MTRSRIAGLAAAVLAAAGGLVAWHVHAGNAPPAAADAPPAALVATSAATRRDLTQTLDTFAEVAPGRTVGLGFARAGQVTRLDVVVGDTVRAGATLATLAPDPATVQAWQQAVDAEGLAQREWRRQQSLLAGHLATQSQVDAAEKAWRDARGARQALEAQGGAGPGRLQAPLDGVVTSVAVAQGDRVAAGAAVLQLGTVDGLRVLVGIEPTSAKEVHAGTFVRLWPLAPGDAAATRGAPLSLRVAAVQGALDPRTQMVDAVALVPPGLAGTLVPGLRLRAQVALRTVRALAVAHDAVLTDERGTYVFQVAGGKARRVAVTRGIEAGAWTAVDGLPDPALPVVVQGNASLQDGMAVREAAR